MEDEFESRGCEMNPELCEEEFDEDGLDFTEEEKKHFGFGEDY